MLKSKNLEWVNMLLKMLYGRKLPRKKYGGSVMKRMIIGLIMCCAVFGLYGKDAAFSLQPAAVPSVIQAGTPLKIKLAWKCPEGYVPKAWRLVAYVPNLPSDFAKVTGNKITPHKMKEWSSVFIMNWIWKIPADYVLVKDTKNWPAGDYRMSLYIMFEARDKNNKVISKMVNENILFTLKR